MASSSRFPVKRYNLLVPDIFPKKQPEVSERVDASTERKYKKLYEYIDKNPHRGPKVHNPPCLAFHLWRAVLLLRQNRVIIY